MKLLIVPVIFLLMVSTVSAYQYCVNETHSRVIIDNQGTLEVDSLEYCPNGCIKGECKLPYQEGTVPVALSVLFSVFSFCFFYVSLNLKEQHGILGWLFASFGILMIISGLFTVMEYAVFSDGLTAILNAVGFSLIILLFIFIFYFLATLIQGLVKSLSGGKPYSKGV